MRATRDDLNITSIAVTFSEALSQASAESPANYRLLEAGANGVFDDGAGDDVSISVTPTFNGDTFVDLIVRDGATPLGVGKYQLTIDGDASIEDPECLRPCQGSCSADARSASLE